MHWCKYLVREGHSVSTAESMLCERLATLESTCSIIVAVILLENLHPEWVKLILERWRSESNHLDVGLLIILEDV